MPVLNQELPGVQPTGLGNPLSGARDTSAEANLAGNVLDLGAVEMQKRREAQVAEKLSSMEKFGDVIANTSVLFAQNAAELEKASGGALTNTQAAQAYALTFDKTSKTYSREDQRQERLAFFKQIFGPNVTEAQADEMVGSAFFTELQQSLQQGYKTPAAIQNAAELQIKKLIAKYPELSDEIRKMAAIKVGYDPAGQYRRGIEHWSRDLKQEREYDKLSPLEKDIIEYQRRVQLDPTIAPEHKQAKIAEGTQRIFKLYDENQKWEMLQTQVNIGAVNQSDAETASIQLAAQHFNDKVIPMLMADIAENGIQVGTEGTILPEQSARWRRFEAEADQQAIAFAAENARRNRQPFDPEAYRKKLQASRPQWNTLLESRDTAEVLKANIELSKALNVSLAYTDFSHIMFARDAFGDNYTTFLEWAQGDGAKWLREESLKDATGKSIESFSQTLGRLAGAYKQMTEEGMSVKSPEDDYLDGKYSVPAQDESPELRQQKNALGRAYQMGAELDDAAVKTLIRDAIRNGGDFGAVYLNHIRNGGKPSEGLKQYFGDAERAVLSDDILDQQVDSIIRGFIAANPGTSKTDALTEAQVLDSISGVVVKDGVPSLLIYGKKDPVKMDWHRDFNGMYKMVRTIASGGMDRTATGVSYSSARSLDNEISARLAEALQRKYAQLNPATE